MSAPNPEDLAAQVSGGADAGTGGMGEDAPEAAGGEDGAGGPDDTSIIDLLLSTEPDESPSDYPDLPDYTAHAIIGFKKVLNELAADDVPTGTPAAVNFTQAGVGFIRSRGEAQPDEDDEGGGSRAGAWGGM